MLDAIAHYRILDRIGAGAMGEVYRARDTRVGRTVAVKLLHEHEAIQGDRRRHFMRDAHAAAALSHPNIAALYEIGEHDGRLYLVFEFVPGEPLTRIMAGRPINPRRALNLAAQVADALAEGHAEGLLHRDVRPANIIVTPKGNAKVLDFGLADWTAGGLARKQAAAGPAEVAAIFAAYMSPEEARGDELDERSDIFSLGVVLYEMLTGARPFAAASAKEVVEKIAAAEPPPPSAVNKNVPAGVDEIVAKAIAKKRVDRYASSAMLAAVLRGADADLEGRADAAPRVPAPLTPQRSSRKWLIAAILLIAIAAGVWYLVAGGG